jgi:hypothetical protein
VPEDELVSPMEHCQELNFPVSKSIFGGQVLCAGSLPKESNKIINPANCFIE